MYILCHPVVVKKTIEINVILKLICRNATLRPAPLVFVRQLTRWTGHVIDGSVPHEDGSVPHEDGSVPQHAQQNQYKDIQLKDHETIYNLV